MWVRGCILSVGMLFLIASQGLAIERHVPSEYATIQAAIDACSDGDEVIIPPGTYTGDGNRDLDYGGLAITVRSTDPNDPNVVASTIIDCEGTWADPHRGFHFHSGEDPNSVLSGITITNGHGFTWGGGIYIENSSPALTKCTLSGNTATGSGGGMSLENSNPTVADCVFSGNEAYQGSGGGMCNVWNSNPVVTNCRFSDNDAEHSGGGICGGNPTVTNCTFSGNRAFSSYDGGGGMYGGNATVTNCKFVGNWAAWLGGGMYVGDAAVTNCTFTVNEASVAGGLCCGSGSTVTNCVLWSNVAAIAEAQIWGSTCLTYSCIEDCSAYCSDPNNHNVGDDPCFVDPSVGDYHLSAHSPCINAGDPNGDYTDQIDIDGEPRVVGSNVDMGADEFAWVLTLDVRGNDKGEAIVDPNDMYYEPNAVVTLYAHAYEGKGFFGWSGDVPAGQEQHNPLTITMDTDKDITATFKCGLGTGPLLPMMLGALGLFVVARRRR